MADGSIIIDTEVNNKKAQAELNRLSRKIESLNNQIYVKRQQQMPLVEQSKQLAAELDLAKEKLYEMQNASTGRYGTDQIKTQQETVRALESEWNRVQSKVESLDSAIQKANIELDHTKEQAGEVERQISKTPVAAQKMASAMESAQKGAQRFGMRIREVVRSALVFTLITQALAQFREWMGKVIKSNAEASAAVAKLKGALLTLAQPLVEVIIPAFTAFVNILAKVVSAIASVLASLFGTTIEDSAQAAKNMYEEQNAIEGVGNAAKKASKSLASFDEINKLSNNTSSEGSGNSSETIKPDFDIDSGSGVLNDILGLVLSIGAGLLAWKIASSFTDSLKTIAGVALAVGGALEFAYSWIDAWNNGIDWGNLIGMVAGLAAAATGLYLALGPTASGITLIVGGLLMLAVGFKDAFENGMNLKNLFTIIAGMLAAGLGIFVMTGNWIPLLIAGIASILLALTYATGHGGELIDGLKEVVQGFADFFGGVFSGDMERAANGISSIFQGLGKALTAVVDGIKDGIFSFLEWLDEKTNGKFTGIINLIKSAISTLAETIKGILGGIVDFLAGVFTGDWERAWDGVKNVFKSVWNLIVGILESAANLIIKGINLLFSGINALLRENLLSKGLEALGISIPQIPEIKPVSIPRLAQGAVIPPNRQFLAMLGDQKSGTNIEAPLATIEQALFNALSRAGYGGHGEAVLEVDGQQFGKLIYRYGNKENQRIGVSLVGR